MCTEDASAKVYNSGKGSSIDDQKSLTVELEEKNILNSLIPSKLYLKSKFKSINKDFWGFMV